jgi:hypothetical protein
MTNAKGSSNEEIRTVWVHFNEPQGAAGILPAEETPCRRDVGSTLLAACRVPGSWSHCMRKSERALSMHRRSGMIAGRDYPRRRGDKSARCATASLSVLLGIRNSSFFGHWSFGFDEQ